MKNEFIKLHPLAYAHDTEAITGEIVEHVDEIAEGQGEELLPTTEWREHFGEALLPILRDGEVDEDDDE
ncbi:hypothetical protein AAVH_06303 [Aphelenchoides avenae]|nr:hypothetical protein AAVH_06303 [Aphelenchus avenae]